MFVGVAGVFWVFFILFALFFVSTLLFSCSYSIMPMYSKRLSMVFMYTAPSTEMYLSNMYKFPILNVHSNFSKLVFRCSSISFFIYYRWWSPIFSNSVLTYTKQEKAVQIFKCMFIKHKIDIRNRVLRYISISISFINPLSHKSLLGKPSLFAAKNLFRKIFCISSARLPRFFQSKLNTLWRFVWLLYSIYDEHLLKNKKILKFSLFSNQLPIVRSPYIFWVCGYCLEFYYEMVQPFVKSLKIK